MQKMTYRERFEATINHGKVDRVPFDFCGSPFTGIDHPGTEQELRQLLGFGERKEGYEKCDERILEFFDIDFRHTGRILVPENNFHGKISEYETIDCWGVRRVFTGLYWDIKGYPLKGAAVSDLDSYPWPRAEAISLRVIDEIKEAARHYYNETDYVVCAEHPVFGVLELGCWMCGYDEFLYKMAEEPEFVYKFFDIILEYQKKVIDLYYGALGNYIHFTTSGDDFGMQTGPLISPRMFEVFVKPYYEERIKHTKKYTKARYLHHSCGSIHQLIPQLIDAGVDILNPIQPGARNMEPERLKKDFGDSLVFHGGIDTQHILPCGSPEEVKDEVFRVLGTMSQNSGYILAPAHNIQADVPAENIVTLYEAGAGYFTNR